MGGRSEAKEPADPADGRIHTERVMGTLGTHAPRMCMRARPATPRTRPAARGQAGGGTDRTSSAGRADGRRPTSPRGRRRPSVRADRPVSEEPARGA
ncbi:hypothetical protein ACFSM7_08340 [Clavibacter michiganensis subsp. tessellarius]|uniref:hypothetical protein n=1 Tax=Clavibacter tessellarius TaxID=31965 RepID=UPI00362DDD80